MGTDTIDWGRGRIRHREERLGVDDGHEIPRGDDEHVEKLEVGMTSLNHMPSCNNKKNIYKIFQLQNKKKGIFSIEENTAHRLD